MMQVFSKAQFISLMPSLWEHKVEPPSIWDIAEIIVSNRSDCNVEDGALQWVHRSDWPRLDELSEIIQWH